MKQEPLLAAGDISYAADMLRVRINELAGRIRRDPDAYPPLKSDDLIERAMSPGARVGDITSAAVMVRAAAIASNRELRRSDYDVLERLGGRIEELDDGDMVAAMLALVACRVRL